MLTAVAGINWGDEGKGRMVDLLGAEYDVVVRYQGGNNAGHTVINDRGKFILNLLPSGILRGDTVNVMGGGMVIDIEHLCGEIESLTAGGVSISPENLKISNRAVICFPFHKKLDVLEEERLGGKKFGSTRRGIAPVYSDKYMKKAIRMCDLLYPDTLSEKLSEILKWKNLTISGGYGEKAADLTETMNWLKKHSAPILPYICDTGKYLLKKMRAGADIMFEAQLGALRDIEYGVYPFTTSSQTLASYATTGAGVPGMKLDSVVGIMKAYSSCVGEGPFTAEFFGEEAELLRKHGGEFGAATGRPRRVGAFDVPASRYGVFVQGADELALTKLDVLSYMEKIPVCIEYEIDGKTTGEFPVGDMLFKAKPVFDYLDGFMTDISKCRKPGELPVKAIEYIKYLEQSIGCKIRYVSVGPERGDYIDMANT